MSHYFAIHPIQAVVKGHELLQQLLHGYREWDALPPSLLNYILGIMYLIVIKEAVVHVIIRNRSVLRLLLVCRGELRLLLVR